MNEIQTGDLGEIPRRRLDINAAGSPVPFFSPIMSGVIVLENDRPEARYLAAQKYAAVRFAGLAASPGVYNACVIYNPAGSGILATFEEIYLQLVAGAQMLLYLTQAQYPLANVKQVGVRDTRWQTGNAGALLAKGRCTSATGTTPGLPAEPPLATFAASANTRLNIPFVLSPGFSLLLVHDTVNIGFTGGHAAWCERTANSDELR